MSNNISEVGRDKEINIRLLVVGYPVGCEGYENGMGLLCGWDRGCGCTSFSVGRSIVPILP